MVGTKLAEHTSDTERGTELAYDTPYRARVCLVLSSRMLGTELAHDQYKATAWHSALS